jgi:hypothetical protein
MRLAVYWWGIKLYIDDAIFEELVRVLQLGAGAVQAFLDQHKLGWIGSLVVTQLLNWGADAIRGVESQCGAGALVLTASWSQWNANVGCA